MVAQNKLNIGLFQKPEQYAHSPVAVAVNDIAEYVKKIVLAEIRLCKQLF